MPELHVLADAAALQRAAAEAFASQAWEAVAARGRFTVALAGGSTPKGMYTLLAEEPAWRDGVPWGSVRVFWGDERSVPPDHPQSNYGMAAAALLARVPLPPDNVFRMRGEMPDPQVAAVEYEAALRAIFALGPADFPVFDLILLGLGTDAHTASLFPGTAALDERRRLAVANRVDSLGTTRITLTIPVINRARAVLFLVSGDDKADALQAVLEGVHLPRQYPAQLVRPESGRLVWLVDRQAARALTRVGDSGWR